jgi:hypothetical protein
MGMCEAVAKEVEYFEFMMPPSIWRKKPHPSGWKMTREDAARRYPGAEPILSTREVRRLPETDAEMMANTIQHQGRAKTEGEERLSAWLVSRIGEKSEQIQAAPNEPK